MRKAGGISRHGSDERVGMATRRHFPNVAEEFNGLLGCDYFSAYRKYMRDFDVLVQFCMAHLIRDVKFLLTLPSREDQVYGQRLRDALRDLFAVIHRREKMTAAAFRKALEAAREQVLRAATTRVPDTKHARNMAKRFRDNGEAYFRFITTPGIGPTNNLAEQAIRFVVIDRHITQGTRSEKGRRWCERIWTAIATCAQQGRAVFSSCSILSKPISPVLRRLHSCRPAPDGVLTASLLPSCRWPYDHTLSLRERQLRAASPPPSTTALAVTPVVPCRPIPAVAFRPATTPGSTSAVLPCPWPMEK